MNIISASTTGHNVYILIVTYLIACNSVYLTEATCGSNADCSFPSGICQSGGCLCDGQHTGVTCADLTSGILHTLLQGGFWGVCVLSLFGGLLLGGIVRFVQHRIEMSRQTNNTKGLMFSYGDVDTFQSRAPKKRVKRKKKKKKKKKNEEEEV
jgi:hypothetical protein